MFGLANRSPRGHQFPTYDLAGRGEQGSFGACTSFSLKGVSNPVRMHSAPVSVFIDACGFRQEEAEKRLSLEAAGLRDGKETEVVAGAFLAERAGDLALDC